MTEIHDAHWHARKAYALAWLQPRTEREGDCLVWTRAVNSDGAPNASILGMSGVNVRRWVFACCVREPRRLFIKVSCGNQFCVAPEHLVARKRSSVMRESWKTRDREADYEARLRARIAQGVKLDMQKARAIRADSRPAAVLAAEYGIHKSVAAAVKSGKHWREPARVASVFDLGGLAA